MTEDAYSSYYMGSLDPLLKAKLADPDYNLVIQNHEFGLPVEHYVSWPVLKKHYKILSTSKDRCRPSSPPPPFFYFQRSPTPAFPRLRLS